MKISDDASALLQLAVEAALTKGAENLIALNVAERFGFADAFLIISGEVERNVQAISDAIEDQLNSNGHSTIRREGREQGRWVLLDFGDMVVHIFHEEERDFYDLERLWKDCPTIEIKSSTASLPEEHEIR